MEINTEYTAQQMLPLLQQQQKNGIVVWDDGNLFFKVVLDLEKEFPTWMYVPRIKNLDNNIQILEIITSGYNNRYDCVYMLLTPKVREYFL